MNRCMDWLCAATLGLANFAAIAADGPTSAVVGDGAPADFPSILNPYL